MMRGLMCCGVKEIAYLCHDKDPKDSLYKLLVGWVPGTPVNNIADSLKFHEKTTEPKKVYQFIFTQARGTTLYKRRHYGDQFAEFILKNKLGKLVKSAKSLHNPNYSRGHQIDVWIWSPNPKALWKWWQENKIDVPERPRKYW